MLRVIKRRRVRIDKYAPAWQPKTEGVERVTRQQIRAANRKAKKRAA